MIVIRLQRIGKKNQPSYRVVLAEKTAPVKGKFIEILGNYNPRLKTKALEKERILYWLSKGAQASPTVHNLLVSEKIVDKPKVKAWTPKKKEGTDKKEETTVVAETPVAETPVAETPVAETSVIPKEAEVKTEENK